MSSERRRYFRIQELFCLHFKGQIQFSDPSSGPHTLLLYVTCVFALPADSRTSHISQTFCWESFYQRKKKAQTCTFAWSTGLPRCCGLTHVNTFMHMNWFLRSHAPASITHSSFLHSLCFPITNVHHHHWGAVFVNRRSLLNIYRCDDI